MTNLTPQEKTVLRTREEFFKHFRGRDRKDASSCKYITLMELWGWFEPLYLKTYRKGKTEGFTIGFNWMEKNYGVCECTKKRMAKLKKDNPKVYKLFFKENL